MTDKLQSDKEALVLALTLAITAPTEAMAQQCIRHADALAAGLSEQEVEACKALAQANAQSTYT